MPHPGQVCTAGHQHTESLSAETSAGPRRKRVVPKGGTGPRPVVSPIPSHLTPPHIHPPALKVPHTRTETLLLNSSTHFPPAAKALCADSKIGRFFLKGMHVQLSKFCFTHTFLCSAKQVRRQKAQSRNLMQEDRYTNYVFMHTHRLICWKFHIHQIKTDKATNSDIIYP